MPIELFEYDYIACGIFHEAMRMKKKGKMGDVEWSFLKKFFAKHKILVLSEEGYKQPDYQERITGLISEGLDIYGSNKQELFQSAYVSFNRDLVHLETYLVQMGKNKGKGKNEITPAKYERSLVATMGVGDEKKIPILKLSKVRA